MIAREDTLVLCYHAVSPTWTVGLSIAPDVLQRQVRALRRGGYQAATFRDSVQSPPAAKTVAITFDDGFRNVFVHGLPALAELDVCATIFPSIAYMDSPEEPRVGPAMRAWIGGPHEHELLPMSWDELRMLSDAGWEIGSHTMTHPYLTELDDDALEWELVASRQRLELELGKPCVTLAYPSGNFDLRVAEAAGRAGYEVACTLPGRFPARPAPLMFPRVSIDHDDGMAVFRMKTSRAMRMLRRSALWDVADVGRSTARRLARR